MSLLSKIYNALGSFNGGAETDKQIDEIVDDIDCNSKEVADTIKSMDDDITHYHQDIVYGSGPPYSWSATEAGYRINKLSEVINKIVENCDACSLNFATVKDTLTATHDRYAFKDPTLFKNKTNNIVEKVDCNSIETIKALEAIQEHKKKHEFNDNFNTRLNTKWICDECNTNDTDSFKYILSSIFSKCTNINRLEE